MISDKLRGRACVLVQKEMIYYHPVHIGDAITAELLTIDINHGKKLGYAKGDMLQSKWNRGY